MNIKSRRAKREAIQHVEWVRVMCDFAGVPDRAVELLERGSSRQQVVAALRPVVHGAPKTAHDAPFHELFTGNWDRDDPDLDTLDPND